MKQIVIVTFIILTLTSCSKNKSNSQLNEEISNSSNQKKENIEIINNSKIEPEVLDDNNSAKNQTELNVEVFWPEKIENDSYIIKKDKELFIFNINNDSFEQLTSTNNLIYDFDYSYNNNLLVFTVSYQQDYSDFYEKAESMNKRKVPTRLYVLNFNNKSLVNMIQLNNESFIDDDKDFSWNKWVNQGIHILGFDKYDNDKFYYNHNYLYFYSISKKQGYRINNELNKYISNFNSSLNNFYATFANYEGTHQRLYDKIKDEIKENALTIEIPLTSYVGGSEIIGILDNNQIVIKKISNDDTNYSGEIVIYDSLTNKVISENTYSDIRMFTVLNNKLISYIDPDNSENGIISGITNDSKYGIWHIANDVTKIIDFSFLPDGYSINFNHINLFSDNVYKLYGRNVDGEYIVILYNHVENDFIEIKDISGSNLFRLKSN